LPEHPKSRSHRRVFRAKGHSTLPQIAGPWFPHSNDASTYDFYCACMLALLKPWQSPHDLKDDNEIWANAFARFQDHALPQQKHVIAGIQYWMTSRRIKYAGI